MTLMAPFLSHSSLAHTTISHGFFGREGGVSEGIYAGLNCGPGSKDNPVHVKENRARVALALGASPENLCTLYQIHSATVVTIERPWEGVPLQADALVTNKPGLVLGILTADCAPILFADTKAGVIGAAHAGWKGAVSGVAENTVAAMEQLGAKRDHIVAVVGSCIAQPSYEVGAEFMARFSAADQARFFIPSTRAGHHQFDLPGFVVQSLRQAGIRQVEALGLDTCSNPTQFYSYRRTTLASEPDYGRQISCIALRR